MPDKALRYNEGKPIWTLIHFESLLPLVQVLEFGAKKYERNNWKKPMDRQQILDSLTRHLTVLIDGEECDKESGLPHIGHIMANAMFLLVSLSLSMQDHTERPIIKPQPGYQEKALSSPADILISGAAAGVGKTFALLMEATRWLHIEGFGVQVFRRISSQVTNQGGLWDRSMDIFPAVGGVPVESKLKWVFPKKTQVKFSHLEYDKDAYSHQGAEYPLIMFDELTHFTRKQFLYLLSRNRSTCGVRPYVRATCNPDPDSWVADIVDPWIDPNTGFPRKDMEGVLKYMVVDGNN